MNPWDAFSRKRVGKKVTYSPMPGHKSAQCEIITIYGYDGMPEDIYLKSYRTIVIHVERRTGKWECSGLYSMTTRKHIGWFLKEYPHPFDSYTALKNAYLKALKKSGALEDDGEMLEIYFPKIALPTAC